MLLDNAGAFDQENERLGAAVHDRDFRPVDLDNEVVNLAPGDSGHQVFHRADGHAVLVAQFGAHGGVHHMVPGGGNASPAAGDAGANENNALVHLGRAKGHGNLGAGMKGDPGTAYGIFQSLLIDHVYVTHLAGGLPLFL